MSIVKQKSVNDVKWECAKKGCGHYQWQPQAAVAVGHRCPVTDTVVDLRRA